MNGSVDGDVNEEYTYTGGRGDTVIDYALMDEEGWKWVEKMEIEDKVDSDHQPMVVWLRGDGERGERDGGKTVGVKRGCGMRRGRRHLREKWQSEVRKRGCT